MTSTVLGLLLLFFWQQNSDKCSSQTLLEIHKNKNSLSQNDVRKLLGTFDESCRNNAEFNEWSNELLFDVLNEFTDILIQEFNNLDPKQQTLIIRELESPINDKYMPDDLIKKVRYSLNSSARIIKALEVAASKY